MNYIYRDPETNLMTSSSLEPQNVEFVVVEDDEFDINTVFIKDGQLVPVPPMPSHFHQFDPLLGLWVDDRNPVEALATARAAASMTRSDFLLATIRAGVLQPSDAGPAARGEIPPSLQPIFDTMDPEIQLEAIVRWGAATMIERSNPILLVLAQAMGLSEDDLDALFRIQLQQENDVSNSSPAW